MKNRNKKAVSGVLLAMALLASTAAFHGEVFAKSTLTGSGVLVNAAAKKEVIGTSAAKKKALADADLTESKVTFTKAKLKKDDGIRYYDIEFYTSSAEYEYEVHAYTGKVLEKDVEKVKKTTSKKSYIGVSKAKEIALKDAGLSASKVDFIKAKLDKDDGKRVYEVEFYQGNMEYDYTIDAYTGEILEWDAEYDD